MIFKKCKLLTLWRISHNQLWVSALISVGAHYCPLISTKLPFRGNWLTSVSECKFWQFVRCFRENMGNHILTWEQCICSQIRSDLQLFLSLAFAMFMMMMRRRKGKRNNFCGRNWTLLGLSGLSLLPFSSLCKGINDSICFMWINYGEVLTKRKWVLIRWGRSCRRSRMLRWMRWRTIDEPRCSIRRLWQGGSGEKQSFVLAFLLLASFLHYVLLTPEKENHFSIGRQSSLVISIFTFLNSNLHCTVEF